MVKNLQIKWTTVAVAALSLAAVVALVALGETDLAAVAGAVGTVLGAVMRQAAYVKPRSEWETDPQLDISGVINTQDGRWTGDGRIQ